MSDIKIVDSLVNSAIFCHDNVDALKKVRRKGYNYLGHKLLVFMIATRTKQNAYVRVSLCRYCIGQDSKTRPVDHHSDSLY